MNPPTLDECLIYAEVFRIDRFRMGLTLIAGVVLGLLISWRNK